MARQAFLYRYRIELHADEVLRSARAYREGLLVQLSEADKSGWGEIAPLPGLSRETLDQAQVDAQQALTYWVDHPRQKKALTDENALLPSVAFGITFALAELSDRLPQAMSKDTAWLATCETLPQLADRLQHNGAGQQACAKIKVGRGDPEEEALAIGKLLDSVPGLTLRLDANRSWTIAKAVAFTEALTAAQRQRIAFIEEPCRTPDSSRAFAARTQMNIAWDESVRDDGFAVRDEPCVRALVIKPTLVGSLERCCAWIDAAHRQQFDVVISSSYESTLGLTQLARLAAWRTPDTVPGLDTANALAQQLERAYPGCDKPLISADTLEKVWVSDYR